MDESKKATVLTPYHAAQMGTMDSLSTTDHDEGPAQSALQALADEHTSQMGELGVQHYASTAIPGKPDAEEQADAQAGPEISVRGWTFRG